MIDHYEWSGGREAMLRFGPMTGPVVIAALPLFEEANRTRTFMVTILRALAERGIVVALPDLPGTGESKVATETASLAAMHDAFAAAAAHMGRPHILSLRSGSLLTRSAEGASRWSFAPQDGESLVHELLRVEKLGGVETVSFDVTGPSRLIAGNTISGGLLSDLRDAVPDFSAPSRVVRLAADQQSADQTYPGSPLWRRAEPSNNPALAEHLANDIVDWIALCAG